MKLKTKILAFAIIGCLLVPQLAYAQQTTSIVQRDSETQNLKKAQLEKILADAESKGIIIDREVENINYENLNLEKIKTQLEKLSSIPKVLDFDNEKSENSNFSTNNAIHLDALDEKVKSLYAQYRYSGDEDVYGNGYTYHVILHVDYDCLFDRHGKAIRIEQLNDTFAVGDNISAGANFTQKGRIIPTFKNDNRRVKLRGKGRFTVGIQGVGGAHYDVEYFCTVYAGDKGYQF